MTWACPNCHSAVSSDTVRCVCGYEQVLVGETRQGDPEESRSDPAGAAAFGPRSAAGVQLAQLPEERVYVEDNLSFEGPDIPLAAIRSISKNGAVRGAVGSLVAWGAINLLACYFLGRDNVDLLNTLSNPSVEVKIVVYGGAIIGATMLSFAIIGAITGAALTILLDGLSLIGVGGWNLIHDVFANAALKPYGYHIQGNSSPIWYILGISQLVWGFRQIGHFEMVSSWANRECGAAELAEARKALVIHGKEAESYEKGILKAATVINGPLGLSMMSKTIQYFGWLKDDGLVLVSTGLNEFLTVTKENASKATTGAKGAMTVATDRGAVNLTFGALSLLRIKQWSGVEATPQDLRFLSEQKKATLPVLRRFLHDRNPEIRSTAVAVLAESADAGSKELIPEYLSDPEPGVRVAALDACRKAKIGSVQDTAIRLVSDPDDRIRAAAAGYLADFPSGNAVPVLERTIATEQNKAAKKALQQALKASKKR